MILIYLLILSKAFKLYVGLLQKVFDPSVSVFDEAGALLLLLDQLLLFFGQHYLNFFEITGEAIQILLLRVSQDAHLYSLKHLIIEAFGEESDCVTIFLELLSNDQKFLFLVCYQDFGLLVLTFHLLLET